jgi:hypothetical protein
VAQPYLEQLQDVVRILDRPGIDLSCKHFFSGAAFYANGKMCASLSPSGLAFKLGRQRSSELVASGAAVLLCDAEGAPKKSGYALFPEPDGLSDESILGYFHEAIDALFA